MNEICEKTGQTVVKSCPICNKRFIPSLSWAYKKDHQYYCRYNCYKQAGGDSGGKDRRYARERVNNIKRGG